MGDASADRAARNAVAALMGSLVLSIREKRFPGIGAAPPNVALREVALRVNEGEFIVLVGPSGCGKSTLLNIVAGLDDEFEGERRIDKRPDGGPQRIGYVFQNPRLLPWRTVYENIALVLPPGRDRAVVDTLVDEMELAPAREVYPPRLSVGMSRRVAIARAFALIPDLLLMDEPFVSLDHATAARLRGMLLRLWRERPTSVLFVTHDLREALFLADRLLLMSAAPGRILGELVVPLPREQRGDTRAIEALSKELTRRHRSMMRAAGE